MSRNEPESEDYDPRDPPDVPYRHPFHDKELADLVRLAAKLGRDMNISGGLNDKAEHWVDYVFKGLIVLAIAGLVAMTLNMRDTLTRIDTYISAKDKENDREFARIYQALNGHDQRITNLERGESPRQPDADYRQKRR